MEKSRKFGKWRAILDLAEALNVELGPDYCAYSEPELEKAVAKLDGVSYRVRKGEIGTVGNISLVSEGNMEGDESKVVLEWGVEYGRCGGREV